MKTETPVTRTTCQKIVAARLRTAFIPRLLPLLLFALPAMVHAQFNYTTNNGAITITGYTGSGGAVSIPSAINGLPVTSIGSHAFGSCQSLTSITIPNTITSIQEYAFVSTGLTDVEIPNNVTSIGADAFCLCAGLTNATVGNSVTVIGDAAFEFCSNLETVTLGNSVASIGTWAFAACNSLTGITIPSSVTNIGTAAFSTCTKLTNGTIPSSVIVIGNPVFRGCTNLIAIEVDTLNPSYSSADGVLFDKSQTTLFRFIREVPAWSYED